MPVKRLVILGSTGSIGRQTLDIVRQHPDKLEVVGLAAGRNAAALIEQRREFPNAKLAVYRDGEPHGVPSGMSAIVDLATLPKADIVVVSVAGVIGLLPTIEAIKAGKDIALASKEVLVAAGEIVMPLVRQHGVKMTPIDSEHSAVFQCVQGYRTDQISEIILTASGGPFRSWSLDQLKPVTSNEALNHPTWRMGGKITIDSATLMNKALEIIEARWLFDVPIDQVSMVIHPQSIVHSFVKFTDGSVLGQCGWPDMRLPIQYALLYPERPANDLKPWNPVDSPNLTFEPYADEVFHGPKLARHAVKQGGTMPCVFNAANEEAANAFLRDEIPFLGIQEAVAHVMEQHVPVDASLESLLEADAWARDTFRTWSVNLE